MKGYKVFESDWTCRGKQYACPGEFEEALVPEICEQGMHFCERAVDCFNYYPFNPKSKVAEVEAYGLTDKNNDKCCTDKLRIIREVSWQEVLTLVNTGAGNTGFKNTGDYNAGDYNTGYRNTGYRNTGCRNTGDYNTSTGNSGCFCTEEHTIMLFDNPSDLTLKQWRDSRACELLYSVFPVKWIDSEYMTAEEKAEHSDHKTTGGYLKNIGLPAAYAEWWDSLSGANRDVIKAIPNFDAEKFYKITGIRVEE